MSMHVYHVQVLSRWVQCEGFRNVPLMSELPNYLVTREHADSFLNDSHKISFLVDLLVRCYKSKEKVVIFSRQLATLDLIELVIIYIINAYHLDSGHAVRHVRLDGATSQPERGRLVSMFNDEVDDWKNNGVYDVYHDDDLQFMLLSYQHELVVLVSVLLLLHML